VTALDGNGEQDTGDDKEARRHDASAAVRKLGCAVYLVGLIVGLLPLYLVFVLVLDSEWWVPLPGTVAVAVMGAAMWALAERMMQKYK